MADGQVTVLGILTGQRNDLGHLLRAELGRCPAPRTVSEHFTQHLLQILVAALRLGNSQPAQSRRPATPPAPNALPIYSQVLGLLRNRLPVRRHQHHAKPLPQLLRCASGSYQPLYQLPLSGTDNNLFGRCFHLDIPVKIMIWPG
jgi:hypothetical protein